jgi:hypothetical protein
VSYTLKSVLFLRTDGSADAINEKYCYYAILYSKTKKDGQVREVGVGWLKLKIRCGESLTSEPSRRP